MNRDTPLKDRFEARLLFVPARGPTKIIRRRFIRATRNPTATGWAAMGMKPGGRYRIELRNVTPRELGMAELPERLP